MTKPKIGNTLNYSIAYIFSAAIPKGIGFIVFMYFASIMSVEEYAKFGINYSMFSIIVAFASAGILESVISLLPNNTEPNRKQILFNTANTLFVIISVVGSLLILLVSSFKFYNSISLFFNYFSIVISGILSALFLFQASLVRLEEKHLSSIAFSFIPSLLSYSIGFIFVYNYLNGDSFFLGSFLGYILSFILFKLIYNDFFNVLNFDRKEISIILSRTPPYLIIAIIGWILGYGNTFFINAIFEELHVATFILLYTISSIIQLVSSSLNQVWSPKFFANYDSDTIEDHEKKYNKFTTIQGLIIGLTGAFILIGYPLVADLFPKLTLYKNNQIELFFLFSAYIVAIPWVHVQNYFLINNKGRQLMTITIISGVLGYLLWILIMIFGGSLGIYIGFLIQSLIRSIFIFIASKKYWNLKFDYIGIIIGNTILLGALLLDILIKGF